MKKIYPKIAKIFLAASVGQWLNALTYYPRGRGIESHLGMVLRYPNFTIPFYYKHSYTIPKFLISLETILPKVNIPTSACMQNIRPLHINMEPVNKFSHRWHWNRTEKKSQR